jgi:hypothetical protein
LIQVFARTRNIDSKVRTPRFDCFKFEFHGDASATFATVSERSGHRRREIKGDAVDVDTGGGGRCFLTPTTSALKHDGFRVIAQKDAGRVRLYSRPGNDLTYRFSLIVEPSRSPQPRAPASSTASGVL